MVSRTRWAIENVGSCALSACAIALPIDNAQSGGKSLMFR
jgi:hypothetical protein